MQYKFQPRLKKKDVSYHILLYEEIALFKLSYVERKQNQRDDI